MNIRTLTLAIGSVLLSTICLLIVGCDNHVTAKQKLGGDPMRLDGLPTALRESITSLYDRVERGDFTAAYTLMSSNYMGATGKTFFDSSLEGYAGKKIDIKFISEIESIYGIV